MEDHLATLQEQDVIKGPLCEEEWGTWISNLVITAKEWDKGQEKGPGDRVQICANLDCCPLNEAVYQTHKPIPTVTEVRHMLKGTVLHTILSRSFDNLNLLRILAFLLIPTQV